MNVWKKRYQYWGFVLPIFVPFLLLVILPVFINLYYSMLEWNGISSDSLFTGFSNYISIFSDRIFKKSLSFNIVVMLFNMSLGNVFSLAMALIATSSLRCHKFARSSYFAPTVLSAILVGFIWKCVFTSMPSLQLPVFATNWLASPKKAVWAMLLVGAWKGSGNGMLYYIAGLLNIDELLYEAARVDGAGWWKTLTHVTIPMLMPMITVNLFLTITGAFNIYDINYALTNGGPANATTSISLRVFDVTFGKGAYGQGSAMAIVLAVIVMTFSVVQVSLTRRKETRL